MSFKPMNFKEFENKLNSFNNGLVYYDPKDIKIWFNDYLNELNEIKKVCLK